MLALECDVTHEGHIELVAIINAVDEEGSDPEGVARLQWRRSHEDGGLGCAPIPPRRALIASLRLGQPQSRMICRAHERACVPQFGRAQGEVAGVTAELEKLKGRTAGR